MATDKDWYEKESAFCDAYLSGRCAKNLWRYIPKRKWCGVMDAFTDADGYWIYLDEGYTSRDAGEECRLIHCYTISDLIEDIKTIRRKEV